MTAPRVLVVGDVMLDRYWHGDVTRISPEAPVPVVKVTRIEDRLGGAANVARNVVALGGKAILVGAIGADEAGRSLLRLSRDAGIIVSHVFAGDLEGTTVKTRVIGQHQQMLRMDVEHQPGPHVLDAITESCSRLVDDVDVVVLSDYGKGALTRAQMIIQAVRKAGKPVLVDPKGKDWSKYHGATLIKPNLAELQSVVGAVTDDAMLIWRLKMGVEAILVTEGESGMTLYWDGEPMHQRAYAREVFDVTGAGDTVIAAMAVAYKANHAWQADMRFASAAAGIVVGKSGTAVATADEVQAVLHG
jgi:rfaE bifunctional protein kinase chain/domain